MVNYKHVPMCLTFWNVCAPFPHIAVFLGKGIVVVCCTVPFVVTDTYTWWQWLLKTLPLLKRRPYLCFIWQCDLDCCQKSCLSVSEMKLWCPTQCCVREYSFIYYDNGNSTGCIKIKLFLNSISTYYTELSFKNFEVVCIWWNCEFVVSLSQCFDVQEWINGKVICGYHREDWKLSYLPCWNSIDLCTSI